MTFYFMDIDKNYVECVDELDPANGPWNVDRAGELADLYPAIIYFEYPVRGEHRD